MSHTLKSLLKISAAAASLSFVVGCASQATSDMQAQVDEAMQMASEAQSTAQSADSKASKALRVANQAQSTAESAQGAANSAQYQADQNTRKIDNMFKKSMMK